jgi:hypothetical protein
MMLWILAIDKIAPEQDSASGLASFKVLGATNLWPLGLWFFLFPLFLLWLYILFEAPLVPMDQWRVSKILEGATKGKGRYGIEGELRRGKAA